MAGGAEAFVTIRKYEADLQQIYKRLDSCGGGGGGGMAAHALDGVYHTATSNNTNLDADATAHGLLLKAVVPGADLLNIVGIAAGGAAWAIKPLFDGTNPEPLGSADPGTSLLASHQDHVHAMPKLDDLVTPDDNTDLNAGTGAHGLLAKLPNNPALFMDGEGAWSPIHGPRILELVDDFVPSSGQTIQNYAGVLNWVRKSTSTGQTVVAQKGTALHPGITQLITYTTINHWTSITLQNASLQDNPIWADDFYTAIGIVRAPIITSTIIEFGFAQDTTNVDFGTEACLFRFNPATHADWQCIVRSLSTSSNFDSTVAVVLNNWYELKIIRVSASSWKFYINGTMVKEWTINLPTGLALIPCFKVTNTVGGAASSRTFDIDYFYFRSKDLGNRWT